MKSGKNTIFALLICSFSLTVAAQMQPVYLFQKDDSLLKKKYYDLSAKRKDLLISALARANASDYKKIYEERLNEVGVLVKSTRCVTSPEASNYLQALVQKIIAANDELKGLDARVIFSRDWWPNAYSMGEGTIAINAGLLVFLNNEAELVFVISHELAHYQLNHGDNAIKKYVETVNSDAYQKELKRLSKEQYMRNQQADELEKSIAFNSRRHSRANEAEADRQAFLFMKKTGYDCDAIKSCLQILDKIDDSLIKGPLTLQPLFEFTGYPFKKKWIQNESSIFSQMDESSSPLTKKEKDSLKTHPACATRIKLLEDSLATVASPNRKKFIVDEKMFNQLKKDFYIEMMEENYKEKNLSRNLYYSLLLLQQKESMPLAIYSIARDLNDVYENQKNHKLGTLIDAENRNYSEDYNLLLRMLNRLRLDEVAELTNRFCSQYEVMMKGYEGFDKEMTKARQKN
jgi:Zn-dependent protease with chaperone function